jgi:predicted PurR-regulated permease PerM
LEELNARARIVYGGIYRGIALIFALLLGIYFVYEIREIALVFLLTLLFAVVLSGPVNRLARRGLPRGLGILVVLGGLTLAVWAASVAVAPVLQYQAEQFVRDFPALLAQAQDLVAGFQSTFGLEAGVSMDPQGLFNAGRDFLSGHTTVSSVVDVGRSIAEAVTLSVVAFIVTVYLVVQPARLVDGFVSLFPAGHRERVRGVLDEMYHAVQKWFLGQLSAMLFIGVLTAVALYVIGIPYALLIGALSGLLGFVPLIGVLVSIIPPVLLALATNPILVVWVVLSYTVIHQIEAHVIQPLVMSRAVALHPVVVVFAILIMGTLFGFVGLLLAVPLVAALKVLVQELWVARMDRMGVDPRTPKQEKTPEKSGLLQRLLRRMPGSLRRS